MNYGKKNVAQKEKQITSSASLIRKKFSVIFFKTLLVCFLAAVVIGGCAGIGAFKGIIESAPDISDIDPSPTGYLSVVLDNQGNETAKLVASGSNRVYVTLDEIPEIVQHAFVAIEDERFYDHNGIDIKGIIRAGITGIANGFHFNQGASTITQQLLKNNVFEGWTNQSGIEKIERKIQEQYLAIELSKIKSKEWVLENYLNTINLGQNTLGVQSAPPTTRSAIRRKMKNAADWYSRICETRDTFQKVNMTRRSKMTYIPASSRLTSYMRRKILIPTSWIQSLTR